MLNIDCVYLAWNASFFTVYVNILEYLVEINETFKNCPNYLQSTGIFIVYKDNNFV